MSSFRESRPICSAYRACFACVRLLFALLTLGFVGFFFAVPPGPPHFIWKAHKPPNPNRVTLQMAFFLVCARVCAILVLPTADIGGNDAECFLNHFYICFILNIRLIQLTERRNKILSMITSVTVLVNTCIKIYQEMGEGWCRKQKQTV